MQLQVAGAGGKVARLAAQRDGLAVCSVLLATAVERFIWLNV
jgi:hypothetical protein